MRILSAGLKDSKWLPNVYFGGKIFLPTEESFNDAFTLLVLLLNLTKLAKFTKNACNQLECKLISNIFTNFMIFK